MKVKQINTFSSANSPQPNKFLNELLLLPKIIGFEAAVWMAGLFYLAFIHSPGSTHFTICPIKNLGFDFCPGCGLGNSISYIFHGELYQSFVTHPLGIVTLLVLIIRIIHLIIYNRRNYGKHFTTDALSSR